MNKPQRLFLFRATITLIVIGGISCNGKKIMSNDNDQKQEKIQHQKIETFRINYKISAKTQLFLNELEKEINLNGGNIKNYKASEKMLNEYNLKRFNETYFVGGFIKVTSSFKTKPLESYGVKFGQEKKEIRTVNVPVYYLKEFLTADNILFFQISEKVSINN